MKILIVSPTPTHQPTAGNRARILALAASLIASGHEVHFAWVPMEEGDCYAMKEMFGDRFHLLSYRKPPAVRGYFPRILRKLQRVTRSPKAYVWKIDDWYDPSLSLQVLDLHSFYSFETVIVEYAYMSRALEVIPESVLKILDTHDRLSDRHLQFLQAGKMPEWFSTSSAEERKGLARAHVVVAIQEDEARIFKALLKGSAHVTTLGHLLDLSNTPTLSNTPNVVLVGSGNSMNIEAAKWFIDEVLPLLRAEVRDFGLVLAGNVCNHINDTAGLRKLGKITSVRDAYRYGCVAVNPLLMGTGLSIKTMDCLALGVPLVSTESGSRGLEMLRGSAFLSVPDHDAAMMAKRILSVWYDENLRAQLSKEARRSAQEWNTLQIESLAQIIGTGAPRDKFNCAISYTK